MFAVLSLSAIVVFPQVEVSRAFIGLEGEVLTETTIIEGSDLFLKANQVHSQLPGWPKKIAAHPNFKNFRGVTLADVDGDGVEDILVASRSTLFAFKGNGMLIWSKTLTGTVQYPPTVAVLNSAGVIGIVQATGGIPANGRIFLLDINGNDFPGWPLNFSNHWILCSPVVADVNQDGQSEIIFQTRTSNNLHVVQLNGTPLPGWPVNLGGTPAITPSVGDIDNDGIVDIIAGNSAGVLFAFDAAGQPKPGFPVPSENYSFSYQSPLLVDLDGTGQLSIVGSTHGNAPVFYVRNSSGTYRTGWPVPVPDNSWTYSPPTVVDRDGDGVSEIFMSRPIGETPQPMLFGFNPDGTMLNNFPITKAGGLEGFISIADITGDQNQDLIFGSNMMVDGQGFIHAYRMDGTGEIAGFPLRPFGFTFMNGPNLGDVNGDGLLDLVALSWEQTFSVTDSTIINVYNLQVPVEQANVLFGTYKGSNDRRGLVTSGIQPVIQVTPTSFNEFLAWGYTYIRTLNIFNSGNTALEYSIEIEYFGDEQGWLSFDQYSGSVNPGLFHLRTLTIHTDSIQGICPPGGCTANILITSNDPNQPLTTVPFIINLYIVNQVGEFNKPILEVYPNPSLGELNLRSAFRIRDVALYSVDGVMVLSHVGRGSSNIRLDLEKHPPGFYVLEVAGENGEKARKKIVIQ